MATRVLDQADKTRTSVVALLQRLFPAPRTFTIRLWDGTLLPATGADRFTLGLTNPAALRGMLAPPVEPSLAQAFIAGEVEVEGDLFAALTTFKALVEERFSAAEMGRLLWELRALPGTQGDEGAWRPTRLRGRKHSRERDRAAIRYHYDVGNAFYALWLDRAMQYSCAYFPTGAETLEEAQRHKMAHICRKLRLQPGERLLDIGCGWGGLARYAAQQYGVQVTGVTLSEAQATYANLEAARAGLGDRVQVKLLDYRDLTSTPFDKIVSVGMFEHVGRARLPEYFAQAFRLLKPGGLFLNHGIGVRSERLHRVGTEPELCCTRPRRNDLPGQVTSWLRNRLLGTGTFVQHYVFPDSELVPVGEACRVGEQAGFELWDVESLRPHYALTLRHWVRRLEAQQAAAVALVGEATYRTWRLYMAAAATAFEAGEINVNQALFTKPRRGAVSLPLTRTDLYRDMEEWFPQPAFRLPTGRP